MPHLVLLVLLQLLDALRHGQGRLSVRRARLQKVRGLPHFLRVALLRPVRLVEAGLGARGLLRLRRLRLLQPA